MATQEYYVDLKRNENGTTTTASVRSFSLELGAKSGDPSAGFNPAEALLAAAGGCITSSMGLVASNSGVQIDGMKVAVTGVRQDSPPKIISIHYELTIDSPDTDRRIDSIFKVARKNSTVLSTLQETMELKGEWHR